MKEESLKVQHTHMARWECGTCPAVGRYWRFMHMLKLKRVSCPLYFCWTLMCLKLSNVCKSSQDQGLAS